MNISSLDSLILWLQVKLTLIDYISFISPHPLANFGIQKNKPRFKAVYSRHNLPNKIKDGAYVISLNYADIGTLLIALYVLNIQIIYFVNFGFEPVPKELFNIKT